MGFDFAHPPVSQISSDLDGVAILLWGANGTGKTPLACGMFKPYYAAFEGGLTGIQGIPYAPMKNWKDFLQFVKWCTSPATTEEAHKIAQTIILDTVDVMADYCIDYTCSQLGISSLGAKKLGADGKQDFSVNGYTEYSREFKRATRSLRNAGFTLVYIAHDGGTREDTDPKTHARYQKMYPSGDKRAIEPICNDVDIIGYMQASPLDDKGYPQFSNIYFAPNNQYHTRSRYPEIVPYIEHVTPQSLADAIIEAKRKELAKQGAKGVTFEEQQAPFTTDEPKMPFNELVDKIGLYAAQLNGSGRVDEYRDIVKDRWGADKYVSDATEAQRPVLEMILFDLEDLLKNKPVATV